MLLPIKAVCERKKIRKDGTSLIFIQYCHSSEHRTLLNTEIAIPPEHWLKKKKKVWISEKLSGQYGSSEKLNEDLKSMPRLAEDLIALADKRNVADRGAFVKELFKPGAGISDVLEKLDIAAATHSIGEDRKASKELFFRLDDYILSKKNKVCKGSLRVYGMMRDRWAAFAEYTGNQLSFDSFDYNFYTELLTFSLSDINTGD